MASAFPFRPVLPFFKALPGAEDRGVTERTYGIYTLAFRIFRVGALKFRMWREDTVLNLDLEWSAKHLRTRRVETSMRIQTAWDEPWQPRCVSSESVMVGLEDGEAITPVWRSERTVFEQPMLPGWAVLPVLERGLATRLPQPGVWLDHGVQEKPGYSFSPPRTRELRLPKSEQAQRFEVVWWAGRGNPPWCFALDGAGRLAMAVSGIEAYVRES
ncbi:MAG: hypothetical protein AAF797_00300 [Planctomycetota bacterium]